MNVSIETMTGLERRLTIALPSEAFETQITERLEQARTQVKLPGFRPGKVPLKEVRRRFGRAVRAEVAGELMQSSFVEAVEQESLQPAGSPNLEVVKMDPGIDFEFTATFEVFPAIEVANFDKLSIINPEATVTDADLENMIERLREQRKIYEPVERVAQADDQIKADFGAQKDGEPVPGTEGTDVEFLVGAGQMIEDFDQAVLGMQAGEEKTFDATFPEDYRAEELKGQTVEFTVSVKEVREPQLPALDDAFFEDFGVQEGGEAAFRDEVRSNMERELENAIKNQVKQQVMDGLADLHEFQLPHAVVHREIHVLKDQMLSQFQMPPGAEAPSLPDELFQEQAEKRVKVGLVVNAVIAERALTVDAEQVDARLQEMAAAYGEPDQVIAWYKSQPEQMQNIEMGVLEDQVVDLILQGASVEALQSTYDDVINGTAIPSPEAPSSDEESVDAESETVATSKETE